MTDWLPDWDAETRHNVIVSIAVALSIGFALVITFLRRMKKGFEGFDFPSVATANWLLSFLIYFVLVGYRVLERAGDTNFEPTPAYIRWSKTWILISCLIFVYAIIRDKRVRVPVDMDESPQNIVWRRRKDDYGG